MDERSGIRILICCPNGAGLSLMMRSMVQKAADQAGLPVARLQHGSIREGVKIAGAFDLVLCPAELVPQLKGWQGQITVIGLRNPLSRRELEDRLSGYRNMQKGSEV